MGMDEFPEDRRDYDEIEQGPPADQMARPKSGRSVFLMVLLVIGGGGLFVCCGGCILFFYLFSPTLSENPAEIIAATDEMLEIQVPEEFEPKGLATMKVGDFLSFRAAMYEVKDGDGGLVLAELGGSLFEKAGSNEMEQMLDQQNQGGRKLRIEQSETREFEIKEQPVDFIFAKGTDPATGKTFRQVSGVVPGKTGQVLMQLQVEDENYDEEAIVQMIESIGK